MKKISFLFIFLLLFILSACTGGNPDPTDRAEAYIKSWHKEDFAEMYKMLSEDAKETYKEKDFVDRYQKIYKDLEIDKLKISYEPFTKEEIKEAKDKGNVDLPIELKMTSIAGDISFQETLSFILIEEEDKDKSWAIDWNPDLIFPGLADGGKIQIKTEKPRRGEILDRNKMPLAINDTAYEVGVIPAEFENEEVEIENIARLLNMSVSGVEERLSAPWIKPEHFVPLKTIAKSSDDTYKQLINIPAVSINETTGRTYPAGEAAAHLTGYIGQITSEELEKYPAGTYKESDMIGKRGLELLYEEQLRGKEGLKIIITSKDSDGKSTEKVLAEKPVQNGEHVQLALDVNLQETIYQSFEGNGGTASAIHPKTGEVLALVSSPSYDPNSFVYGISQANWDVLMNDPNTPFVNRFATSFAPGSVIKPITAAIGLNSGKLDPDEALEINGLRWGKDSWNGYKITRVTALGMPVDLRLALIHSDNIYFARQAMNVGGEDFVKGLKSFGFTKEIPIAFPIEKSSISNSGKLDDEVLLANTAYGQGEMETTSLHMALMYTPILNEGNLIKPSFLVEDKKGEVWEKNLISKENAELLQDHLLAVVEEGSGKKAKDKNLSISGKTGTAELKLSQDSQGHENGWFIGYPTKQQDIIVAMMVEKAENIGASSYTADKVKNILKSVHKK